MSRNQTAAVLLGVCLGLAACDTTPTGDPLGPEPTRTIEEPVALAASLQTGGTWEIRAPIPHGRLNFAAGVIPNASGQTIFYAIGGENARGDATTNLVEAYNPLSNTWAAKARLPQHRVFPNGTGVINGKLYLSGGYDGSTASSDVGFTRRTLFVYDPATNIWFQKKMMPFGSASGVTGVIDGRLYVLTGVKYECQTCPTVNTRSLFRYDPASDTWKKLASAPNPHVSGVGGVINRKFYVAGGGRLEQPTRRLDVYDPATDSWSSRAPMPTARDPGSTGAVVGGKLYLTGGGSSVVEAYDPATNTWSRGTDAPDPARWDEVAGTIKNSNGIMQLIVVGAYGAEFGFPPGETLVYTPSP
jgi:N-acetylneuraminic acid mutarotase